MEGRHQFRPAISMETSAKFRNSFFGLKMALGGDLAERDNDLGSNQFQLTTEKRTARFDFVGFRRAVFGRAALHDVCDENVLTFETDRLDHSLEQLARFAKKGPSLQIFLFPRAFADEHETGVWHPFSCNDGVSGFAEFAMRAGFQFSLEA